MHAWTVGRTTVVLTLAITALSSEVVAQWSDWIELEGDLAAAPAVAVEEPDRLHVFVRGPHDDDLVHRWWNGSKWSGWDNLGGHLTSAPAVVSLGAQRLDVFARSAQGSLIPDLLT